MGKSIMVKIAHSKTKFTYLEQEISQYFLEHNPCIPANELSKKLNISPSSITRFCKKIGLSNYKELMYLYSEYLNENENHNTKNIPKYIHTKYLNIIEKIDSEFDYKKIDEICTLIHNTRFINIFALGLSATAAQDFKFRFSRIGKFIEVVHDKDAIEMTGATLKKDDLVFIFTLRGNSALEKCAEKLKPRGINIISITGNPKSTLVKNSNQVLITANLEGEESTGIISAQIPMVMQIDIIYYYYVKKYNETLEQWVSTEKTFVKDKKLKGE